MNHKIIAKSNFVLRRVLNKEENLDIIKDFIEAVLNVRIIGINLRKYPENKYKFLPSEDNFGIANVIIRKDDLSTLNIGIQILDGNYIQNKILLYYAQIHTNQLEEEKKEITTTVTINILHFNYFNNIKYHQILKIKEKNEENEIEIHILELPKFSNKNIIENKKDAWIAYLQGGNEVLVNYAIDKFIKIQKLDRLLDEYWKNEKME